MNPCLWTQQGGGASPYFSRDAPRVPVLGRLRFFRRSRSIRCRRLPRGGLPFVRLICEHTHEHTKPSGAGKSGARRCLVCAPFVASARHCCRACGGRDRREAEPNLCRADRMPAVGPGPAAVGSRRDGVSFLVCCLLLFCFFPAASILPARTLATLATLSGTA